MSTDDKLIVTLERGVKRITFNRAERRNAVDFEMFEAFAEAIEQTASDGTRARREPRRCGPWPAAPASAVVAPSPAPELTPTAGPVLDAPRGGQRWSGPPR